MPPTLADAIVLSTMWISTAALVIAFNRGDGERISAPGVFLIICVLAVITACIL